MEASSNSNLYSLLKNDPNRVYVIAEAGLNHGGSKERALALVRAAKWAGADAVKFQTFRADRLASTRPATLAHTKDQPNLQELFRKLELPFDAFRTLYKEASRLNIDFLSTPFDEESADFLDELGVSAFKIASRSVHGEIAYLVWSSRPSVPMATDTLLVRNGKILVQTFTSFNA